jgi:uncharacterized protein (TIGR02217 family)
MGFHDVQFPDDIAYGTSGGPGFKTDIVQVDSGAEERVARWSHARHRYNVAYGTRRHDQLSTLIDFYHAREGAANGFRFKDYHDFTTAANHRDTPTDTDQVLGTGDGTTVAFQLVKRYSSGFQTYVRTIEKPVFGTTVIAIDGTPQPSGWTVDTTTGIVTFAVAPALNEALTDGCEFDVPVRFEESTDDWLAMDYDDYSFGSAAPGLIELVNEDQDQGDFFYGGASAFTITQDHTLAIGQGRFQTFDPQSGGLDLILPDPANFPAGGPYFYLANVGANTVTVKTHAAATVGTIATSDGAIVVLSDDGVGGKTWYLF